MKRIYNTEYSIESLYDGFIASMVQKNLRSFCIPFLEGKISINNVETKLWKFYLEVGLKKTSPEDEMIFFENKICQISAVGYFWSIKPMEKLNTDLSYK